VKRSELIYHLPPERIAQRPAEPRDSARLMVLHRAAQRIEHRVFSDIADYLRPGDCLVLNDTRVIPARFFCRRPTGGRVEALFLRTDGENWRVLLRPSARLARGRRLTCDGTDVELELAERHARGEWSVRPRPAVEPLELLRRVGRTPLPPYIERAASPDAADAERYQTVYAERPGAVAAPTAGLHFTPQLLNRLQSQGVRRAAVTLHVGPGTFAPIDADDLADHVMHAEWYGAGEPALREIDAARRRGGRIIAVGTTSVRVLETLASADARDDRPPAAVSGWTSLLIYPRYRFRAVDALITNFHLPESTLLALVMALAGAEFTRRAYAEAVAAGYRFYSYGDAMLIL
jgi:S-adenosylmethionine:tRNA ribosyltransferase-isomerase